MTNENQHNNLSANRKTRSLKELFEEQLDSLPFSSSGYQSIDEVLSSDQKAIEFINHVLYLDRNVYDVQIDTQKLICKERAKHSVISFLFGLCVGDFCELLGNCSHIFDMENRRFIDINEPYINYKLWMMTSANHDYGYYSKYIHSDLEFSELIRKLKIKHNVLEVKPSILGMIDTRFERERVMKNSSNKIIDYYDYARRFHKEREDYEIVDHGILGGLLIYDRIINQILEDNPMIANYLYDSNNYCDSGVYFNNVASYKAGCLTICQHNFFKSKDSVSDELYGEQLRHLWHDRGYYIDKKHPLLLFLSLIDTIEHKKRFSTKNAWLRTNTLLEKVKLSVDKSLLIIDYSELYAYLDKNLMQKHIKVLNDHINGVCNLETWTRFKANRINDYAVAITYDESNLTIDCN